MHWFNDGARKNRVAVPTHLVLPEALTGVKAKIVVALGDRFPMIGAHKVLAAYGCLVPRLVSGRFDPTSGTARCASTVLRRGGCVSTRGVPRRGVLPEGMSRERFRLARALVTIPRTSSGRRSPRAREGELHKCAELERDPHNVSPTIFRVSNYLVLTRTGRADASSASSEK